MGRKRGENMLYLRGKEREREAGGGKEGKGEGKGGWRRKRGERRVIGRLQEEKRGKRMLYLRGKEMWV